jgi:hypothetical protein
MKTYALDPSHVASVLYRLRTLYQGTFLKRDDTVQQDNDEVRFRLPVLKI